MAADVSRKARKFREYWLWQRGSEKGEDQQFWNMLLRDVLGMDEVERRLKPQVPVPMKGTTKFLDFWIPETKVLIEHKSRDIKLDAPQSSHGGKTPFEQALEYNQARGYSDKARWIVTCNFDEIWVYDMNHPLEEPQKIRLTDLPKEVSRLGFLVDASIVAVRDQEKDISIKAGRIIGEIYRELLKRYAEPDSPETLKHLNRLCVRLVFLFYAEDAELFDKDAFWSLLTHTPAGFLRQRLLALFRALDTPKESRDPYLEPEIAVFPYTNGGLFKGVDDAEIPPLDEDLRALLVKSSNFDWREISPTIFGALFESTLNPETRRSGGMVYTSVENIHKVIDPLFLDGLKAELEEIRKERSAATRSARAREFQARLGGLKFLDPACGSGNFLTETFLSLRKLENEAVKLGARLKEGERLLNLDGEVKVTIDQFKGIEINDFAVAVAKTAMWISEAKMLRETAEILDAPPKYLPLHDYDGIIEGNALHLDWPEAHYIMGNPPFSGARWMGKSQKDDMLSVFGKDWHGVGDLDYVTAWYKRAVDSVAATKDAENTKVAFVSTNSICQGGAVVNLWKPLFEQGLEIDFAHRTFRWDNESVEKAHVHCVIVGFHCEGKGTQGTEATKGTAAKTIFDGERKIEATHINGYLMNAQDVWIESRTKPLCDVPEMGIGNKPIDGGNYLFTKEEKDEFLKKEPQAERYFHPWYGAEEFINGKERYCLWLGVCTQSELFALPECLKRVQAVRDYRLASKSEGTRKIADKPTRFHVENMPKGDYIVVPKVSSERRQYVPFGFFTPDTFCSDLVFMIPNAKLYHFGVLTSSVHMAWMRAVAGRLKSDYRYSANIVYNNFPWPGEGTEAAEATKAKISATAQAILDARAKYTGVTLAQMYGDKMYLFPELVAAHAANDRAVLAAYGLKPDTPEPEIVAHLFRRYAEGTEGTKETKGTGRSLRSLKSLKSLAAEGGVNG